VKRAHPFSPATVEAARLLGSRIEIGRRDHHWTVQELADRVGVSRDTIYKIEHGVPTVGLGVAFEAAAIVGVPLFDEDPSRRLLELSRADDRLALLPKRTRKPLKVNDEF
jgi:transcriptional regulator with XRE-family HTH domain